MKISIGIAKGMKKECCDDSVLVNQTVLNDVYEEEDAHIPAIIAIADGVGGNPGGRDAGIFVLEELSKMIFNTISEGNIRKEMNVINFKLLQKAQSIPKQSKMATTLTALLFLEEGSYLVHIGNTRLYAFQGNYMKQMTKDHTTYQQHLDRGNREAAELCNKNEITACMGGGDEKYFLKIRVQRVFGSGIPNKMVLTSDGIHEYVDIDTLEKMINTDHSHETCRKIIEMAEEHGSQDDKTIVMIRK